MATLVLEPTHGEAPPSAEARYVVSEAALVVGPGGSVPPDLRRGSLGPVTLSFTEEDRVLVAIDAYVNISRCTPLEFEVPPDAAAAAVTCTNSFDSNGIAEVESQEVDCLFNSTTGLLLLRVRGSGEPDTHIRCLDGVVCGLGKNREVQALWIDDLRTR